MQLLSASLGILVLGKPTATYKYDYSEVSVLEKLSQQPQLSTQPPASMDYQPQLPTSLQMIPAVGSGSLCGRPMKGPEPELPGQAFPKFLTPPSNYEPNKIVV